MFLTTAFFCLLTTRPATAKVTDQVAFVHFLPDGNHLVVARGPVKRDGQITGRIEVTDLKGNPLRVIVKGAGINNVAVSRDGQTIAIGGRERQPLEVRSLKDGHLIRRFVVDMADYPDAAFLADGKSLLMRASALFTEYGHLEAQTCTLPGGEPQKLISSDGASQFAVDPMGKWIAVATARVMSLNQLPQSFKFGLQIYNASTGALEQAIRSDARISELTFSSDGQRLAARAASGKIQLWDTGTWQTKQSFISPSVPDSFGVFSSSMEFTADGKTLLVGLGGVGVAIYDIPNKGQQRTFYSPSRTFWRSIDLSPNGKTFAVGTTDGTAEVRSIRDGRLLSSGSH